LPYTTFLGLLAKATVVLTDSGGIQEETTAFQVPCLTLRKNTERPSTVELGTNELVGGDLDGAEKIVGRIVRGKWRTGVIPPLWDGRAAVRSGTHRILPGAPQCSRKLPIRDLSSEVLMAVGVPLEITKENRGKKKCRTLSRVAT
jgi:hypothetical protein